MGYAIFTARKLMLTNRINQLNWRIMQLTQQQQTLADQSARAEMAMANMRNLFSSVGSMMSMSINGLQQKVSANWAAEAQNCNALNGQLMLQQMAPFVQSQQNLSNIFGIVQQSLDLQNQAQLKQIKDAENNIKLQRKSLETQVSAASKELEKVEQQEEKSIEKCAPKFG